METGTSQQAGSTAAAPAADRAKLERARRRLAAIKGFYIHLAVFVLVVGGLLLVNVTTRSEWWVHWVLVGWGIGVAAHGLAVLGRTSRMVADWERRKLEQLMQEP